MAVRTFYKESEIPGDVTHVWDNMKDPWTCSDEVNEDGETLWYSPETKPFPLWYVLKKWGPVKG